jgi:type VI protein secretion system component Hcp
MEKIMSKTNDTSNTATFEHHDVLADSELDAVIGGADRSAAAPVLTQACCAGKHFAEAKIVC